VKIVDGHNLIGAAGGFGISLAQHDKEERLLRLLAAHRGRRRSREPMLVVFDGHHGRLAHGPRRYSQLGIEVEVAVGEPADAVILRRVRAAANPRDVTVISADGEVLSGAAVAGARAMRSREFLERVREAGGEGEAPEKPGAPDAAEVAEWLERFERDR